MTRQSPEVIARLHELLGAGDATSAAARANGLSYFTANYWARRARHGIPWADPIGPYTCTVCGEPGLGYARADGVAREVHPACEPEWQRRYAAHRRLKQPGRAASSRPPN